MQGHAAQTHFVSSAICIDLACFAISNGCILPGTLYLSPSMYSISTVIGPAVGCDGAQDPGHLLGARDVKIHLISAIETNRNDGGNDRVGTVV